MKKALVLIAVLCVPAFAHADFQLGGTGMYNADIATFGTHPISSADFTYGLEARFKFLSVLQVGCTGLYYTPSAVGGSSYIQALTDLGLSLDLFILRLGVGVGPDFFIPMSGPSVDATSVVNLKLTADINIGPVALGVIAFYPAQSIPDLLNFTSMTPWVGLTLMIQLF